MDFISTLNFTAILKIILVDIMLGLDNAIVIALACASLAPSLRNKAIFWGTAGAVGLRAILLVFATLLLGVPFLKIVAGFYLVFIGYKLLVDNEKAEEHVAAAPTVWGAITTIIIADFMMSLDNVMAVAGASSSVGEHSTLYAIAGILFSIPIIVYGATFLTKYMERFPIITWIGAGMLGYVGGEMIVGDSFFNTLSHTYHLIVPAVGATIVVVAAYFRTKFQSPAVVA